MSGSYDFPSASYDNWKTTDPNEYYGQPHPYWPDLDIWEDREIIEYLERLDADEWPEIDEFDLALRCGDDLALKNQESDRG